MYLSAKCSLPHPRVRRSGKGKRESLHPATQNQKQNRNCICSDLQQGRNNQHCPTVLAGGIKVRKSRSLDVGRSLGSVDPIARYSLLHGVLQTRPYPTASLHTSYTECILPTSRFPSSVSQRGGILAGIPGNVIPYTSDLPPPSPLLSHKVGS